MQIDTVVKLIARDSTLVIQICDASQHGAVIDGAVLADLSVSDRNLKSRKAEWFGASSHMLALLAALFTGYKDKPECVLSKYRVYRPQSLTEYLRAPQLKMFDCIVLYAVEECKQDDAWRLTSVASAHIKDGATLFVLSGDARNRLLKQRPQLYGPKADTAREASFKAIIERLLKKGLLLPATPTKSSSAIRTDGR